VDAPAAGIRRTFSALRHRNYRLLWLGTLISNSGDWMDQVALNWLVISTSGDPFHLALVNLCRGLPILAFTLVGGAVADRVERRRLMLRTQGSSMALALLLALLVLLDYAPIWAILLVATGRGVLVSFNLPARHSLIPDLVPTADLPNAIALNSLTINLTKVMGPALAGLIIGWAGVAACFLLNGLSYLVILGTLRAMDLPVHERRVPTETLGSSIRSGLAHVGGNRTLLLLVLVALVPTFLGQPYITLLAIFAHDVFRIGPEGLGLLTSCAAAGSVGGALLLAAMPRWASSGRAMLVFLILFGALLIGFASVPVLGLALPLLFGAGAMQIACNASNATILQLRVEDAMRGRIMSVLLLNRGLAQLGGATAAAIAGVLGVQAALGGAGAFILLIGLALLAGSRLSHLSLPSRADDG